jgi:hypothetical protein
MRCRAACDYKRYASFVCLTFFKYTWAYGRGEVTPFLNNPPAENMLDGACKPRTRGRSVANFTPHPPYSRRRSVMEEVTKNKPWPQQGIEPKLSGFAVSSLFIVGLPYGLPNSWYIQFCVIWSISRRPEHLLSDNKLRYYGWTSTTSACPYL